MPAKSQSDGMKKLRAFYPTSKVTKSGPWVEGIDPLVEDEDFLLSEEQEFVRVRISESELDASFIVLKVPQLL